MKDENRAFMVSKKLFFKEESTMKKHILWQICVICIIVVVASLPAAAQPTAANPMVEKMAHVWPATSWPGETIKMFGDGVEKATGGKIKFQYFLGGTLYSTYGDAFKSVMDGVQPFLYMYPPMLAAHDQRWNVMGLPGAIMGDEHMQRISNQSAAYKKLNEEYAAKSGVKVLFWYYLIPYGDIPFNTKRPLVTPDDWKGLKIRVAPMEVQQMAVRALGASPIVLQTLEVLSAVSQGTVDGGIITPGTAMTAWKADETMRYLTIPYGGWAFNNSPIGFIVNVKWWNKLPKDMQDSITKAVPDIIKTGRAHAQKRNEALLDKYKAVPKNTVTYLTAEQTKVWEELVQKEALPTTLAKIPGMKTLYDDFRKYR
jgi:C4-dicarboxylate-binding protein DctP